MTKELEPAATAAGETMLSLDLTEYGRENLHLGINYLYAGRDIFQFIEDKKEELENHRGKDHGGSENFNQEVESGLKAQIDILEELKSEFESQEVEG